MPLASGRTLRKSSWKGRPANQPSNICCLPSDGASSILTGTGRVSAGGMTLSIITKAGALHCVSTARRPHSGIARPAQKAKSICFRRLTKHPIVFRRCLGKAILLPSFPGLVWLHTENHEVRSVVEEQVIEPTDISPIEPA